MKKIWIFKKQVLQNTIGIYTVVKTAETTKPKQYTDVKDDGFPWV